ncbi:hypothetical protein ACQWHS_25360, partial [Salmonella enterica subsp. enterica serovar Infantis]
GGGGAGARRARSKENKPQHKQTRTKKQKERRGGVGSHTNPHHTKTQKQNPSGPYEKNCICCKPTFKTTEDAQKKPEY